MSTSVTISATSGPQTSTEPCGCCAPPVLLDQYHMTFSMSYHYTQNEWRTLYFGADIRQDHFPGLWEPVPGYSGYPWIPNITEQPQGGGIIRYYIHHVWLGNDISFERFGTTPAGRYTEIDHSINTAFINDLVVS